MSNYFFPFLLVEPFCCVFVEGDDAAAAAGTGVTDTGADAGALLGGLCKKLMKKVATPPLIMYMSHLGTRTSVLYIAESTCAK